MNNMQNLFGLGVQPTASEAKFYFGCVVLMLCVLAIASSAIGTRAARQEQEDTMRNQRICGLVNRVHSVYPRAVFESISEEAATFVRQPECPRRFLVSYASDGSGSLQAQEVGQPSSERQYADHVQNSLNGWKRDASGK